MSFIVDTVTFYTGWNGSILAGPSSWCATLLEVAGEVLEGHGTAPSALGLGRAEEKSAVLVHGAPHSWTGCC